MRVLGLRGFLVNYRDGEALTFSCLAWAFETKRSQFYTDQNVALLLTIFNDFRLLVLHAVF